MSFQNKDSKYHTMDHGGKFTTNDKVEICVGDRMGVWEDLDKDILKLVIA